MSVRSGVRRLIAPLAYSPRIRARLTDLDLKVEQVKTALCTSLPILVPTLIRPDPRFLQIAVTAHCNLRCMGCRYGRDFMPGAQLSLSMVKAAIDDASDVGMVGVRFYGGEPLLHPDLPQMVEHAVSRGLRPWVTTNAILLKERMKELYAAGLRAVHIGFYGVGAKYDDYVQRRDRFKRLEAGIAAARERYGKGVYLCINWLLMRPSCNIEDLHDAWQFAEKYSIPMQIDLIHYSLPYFTEGPNRELQFRPEDRQAVEMLAAELVRLKKMRPDLLTQSAIGLRSIPDWVIKGPEMRVPCDFRETIWIGADGTVQLCYVTFRLGNLHDRPLRDMLFTSDHRQAARDSFSLRCPNCHCNYDKRVQKHLATGTLYSGEL